MTCPEAAHVAFDPVACRVPECPMTAQACVIHRPDPQVGDEVVLRGIVTQRAVDSLGRDIVQVTRGSESYWFARAEHAEPAPQDACPACHGRGVQDYADGTSDDCRTCKNRRWPVPLPCCIYPGCGQPAVWRDAQGEWCDADKPTTPVQYLAPIASGGGERG